MYSNFQNLCYKSKMWEDILYWNLGLDDDSFRLTLGHNGKISLLVVCVYINQIFSAMSINLLILLINTQLNCCTIVRYIQMEWTWFTYFTTHSDFKCHSKSRSFRKNFIFTSSLKDTLATLKFPTGAWFICTSNRQSNYAILRGFYSWETSHMRSFARIKLSRKFLNLQYFTTHSDF